MRYRRHCRSNPGMSRKDDESYEAPQPPGFDLRREERVETTVAVAFADGTRGVACNVSAAGFYVETQSRLPLGGPLAFTIDFGEQPGGSLRVSADAKILRVEEREGRWGHGAAIQWRGPVRP